VQVAAHSALQGFKLVKAGNDLNERQQQETAVKNVCMSHARAQLFQSIYFQPRQRCVADPIQRVYLEALPAIWAKL
jgi:hypothetical protein